MSVLLELKRITCRKSRKKGQHFHYGNTIKARSWFIDFNLKEIWFKAGTNAAWYDNLSILIFWGTWCNCYNVFKLQELIGLIRHTKIPIICMCNDRNHPKIRSLVHYCFDLRFQRPRLEQIKVKMAAWLILNYQQQSYLCVAQFIENWKTCLKLSRSLHWVTLLSQMGLSGFMGGKTQVSQSHSDIDVHLKYIQGFFWKWFFFFIPVSRTDLTCMFRKKTV